MNASRNALVTGASGGIGAATAGLLADRGYNVWLAYVRDQKGANRTADACRAKGVQAVPYPIDLRSPEETSALAAEIGAAWGSLHVVVNNAGTCPYTEWSDISVDEWDLVMETNARGTFLMIKHTVPLLREATGDRSIVNIASLAGQVGGLSTSLHYSASKAAVLALTRSFARRLAPERIRVNAVSPGPIDTTMTAGMELDTRAQLTGSVPLGQFGQPENVAQAITLLASPDAAFTTGATYDVNGGLRMD